MDESKKVGPERILHVERIVNPDRRTVEYHLCVHHRIVFPADDADPWCIPKEYVAAVLSDGLREFVNSCQCADVIQKCIPSKNERDRLHIDKYGQKLMYNFDEEN